MTIDLLDLLLVAHFCFEKPVPWWMWIAGILSNISAWTVLRAIRERK